MQNLSGSGPGSQAWTPQAREGLPLREEGPWGWQSHLGSPLRGHYFRTWVPEHQLSAP